MTENNNEEPKEEESETEPIIQPKSSWQGDNCLFCSNKATHEAVIGRASIRCCDNEECQSYAKETAKDTDTAFH